ncbi:MULTISPECIES: hypothetical protein [unclassified Microbacterium]|uniref:hypothetical protein n=1 Tax=unclassified Microbacterium TaxID=2609290 RepID=UPI000EA976CC|nr:MULTISPECIES: hypothetical protein [unclassified Microbacterium]MBT2484836.1 hypothetical protein [Microbacterium sp. ISL-108]RKN67706.1 hypothetical protein D7252_08965 [Microbacterium sp. CGR2]
MNLTPLEEAHWVYTHREEYDRQQRYDAAVSLSQWGRFSLRQVAAICGIAHSTVKVVAGSKSEKTGGRFNPACLPILIDIRGRRVRGEAVDADTVRRLVSTGTSLGFAARLSEIPESYLRRRLERSEEAA